MKNNQSPILLVRCKAYHTLEETQQNIEHFVSTQTISNANICFALPYTFVEPISAKLTDLPVTLGAETMLSADQGSFTETVAAKILKKVGAQFVLLESEDRTIAGDHTGIKKRFSKP